MAQLNRSSQASNITSNIYPNNANAVTPAILQGVMLNQNNSYVNLLSDTNLLDIRLFSPYANYTPGMGAFYGDTLFMNVSAAHGSWAKSDWVEISSGGCVCSSYLKYIDTVGGTGVNKVVTPYYGSVNYVASAISILVKSGSSISIPASDFTGNKTYNVTNSSGTESFQLPNPSTVVANKILWISMVGKNIPQFTPFATELLDGQSTPTTGYWIVPPNSYFPGFSPSQKIGIYTDNTNWFTK